MSFYDDASLVFLPSGGAGKDGKAYSIKPVPEYGTELVTNGDFATDSDWTKGTGWSISGGKAVRSGASGNSTIYQNVPVVNGKKYIFSYTRIYVSGNGETNLYVRLDGVNYSTIGKYISTTNEEYKVVGEFTAEFTGNLLWQIYGISDFTGSIDNVSVREVIEGDGDFTFSRGSNLTATRIDSNGLIEKGRENLLLQSNQFDTTWTLNSTSVTSGQSGYDGSSDAWLIQNTGNLLSYVFQSVSQSGVQTFSIYAKGGNVDWMRVNAIVSGSNANAYFDITNGTIGTSTAAVIDKTITPVGNSFYRISLSFNDTISQIRVQIADGDGDENTPLGSNIYIQDAQLEIGLVATEYIESGASTGLAGILEDSPRFDYSGGASCPSLLLEGSRTNLITQSEFIGSSDWFAQNITETQNYSISPEGLQNAILIDEGSASSVQHWFWQNPSFGVGITYTISIYAKYVDRKNMVINLYNGSSSQFVFYDIQNGAILGSVGDVVADIIDVGNGWYRLTYTREVVGVGANFRIGMASDTPSQTYNGENKQALIYGLQLEEGSYPTSYIPNHSGGSVTRDADVCDKDGFVSSGITTSSNFTFYMELEGLGQNGNPQVYLEDVSENRILSLNLVGQKNRYGFYSPDASNYISTTSHEADGVVKIAATYDGTDFKEYFNGVEKGTRAASVTVGIDGINFNKIPSNSIAVHKAILFPTTLSTTDCEILTGATSYESFSAMAAALNYTTYE